jgi:hypothetical protein
LILAAVSHCGVCRHAYASTDFSVIGHREHLWMIAVQCPACQHQGLITAVVEGHGIEEEHTPRASRAEFFADETAREARDPVTVDDLLDLHDFLDDFNGDFAGLFARRNRPTGGGHA